MFNWRWLIGLVILLGLGARFGRIAAANAFAWRATHLSQPIDPTQAEALLRIAAQPAAQSQITITHFAAWLTARALSGDARLAALGHWQTVTADERPFPSLWLAEALAAQGQYQPAIALWQAAGAAEQLYQLGEHLAPDGDPAARVAAYQASLALWPRDVIFVRLGDLLTQLQRYDEALVVYLDGQRFAPTNYGLYVGAGNVYRAQGQYAQAQAWYDIAVRRSGVIEWPYLASGRAYELQGDLDRARARYTAVVQANPANCEAWGRLGLVAQQMTDLAEALSALERAAALCPTSVWVWMGLGDVRQAQQDWAGAVTAYTAALNVQPQNSYAQAALALARAHLPGAPTP